MAKKKFLSLHKKNLLTAGANKVWCLKDLLNSNELESDNLSKRTIERWISEIPWLMSSHKPCDQIDELNQPASIIVFNALVNQARKKRNATLFIQLHSLSVEDNIKQAKKYSVLVAENGKGAKRWCLLLDKNIDTIVSGFSLLTENKPTTFFPSKNLINSCRKINLLEKTLKQEFDIAIGHFRESTISDDSYNMDSKTVNKIQTIKLSHLDRLEAESLHIIREVVTQAENPVMLYSIGKDSAVMLHLARKAFYPSSPPFPLMHIDTRWKFQAMYDFRDAVAKASNMKLIVHTNPEGIEKDINPFEHGSSLHTDIMKTQGLKQALNHHKFDLAFGGARRDEEKSRAKERVCSFRSSNHRWDPKNQRPEIWNLFNCRKAPGESIRVFPLSNWTELDIWQYIYQEKIPIVPLYFSAIRPVVNRNGMLIMVDDDRMQLFPGESIEMKEVRFRTLGCYPLTGAVQSSAKNLPQIILELLQNSTSERQGRAIDSDSSSSMEKKKQEGYF